MMNFMYAVLRIAFGCKAFSNLVSAFPICTLSLSLSLSLVQLSDNAPFHCRPRQQGVTAAATIRFRCGGDFRTR